MQKRNAVTTFKWLLGIAVHVLLIVGLLGSQLIIPQVDKVQAATLTITGYSAGNAHNCILLSTGTVKCWGFNDAGQTGSGNLVNPQLAMVDVPGIPGTITGITAGLSHTCAVNLAGAVYCWGLNGNGQLGDGTTTTRLTPVLVSGLSSGATANIAAGFYSTCVRLTSGGVKCWGQNTYGQLGDGTTTQRLTPVNVLTVAGGAALTGVAGVWVGNYHVCVRTTASGVKCWGQNNYGQLGDNTVATRTVPVNVLDTDGVGALAGIRSVTVGANHTCAMYTTTGAVCWGRNDLGQLGNGTTTVSHIPDVLPAFSGVTLGLVAAGNHFTCAKISAVGAVGGIKCWGQNDSGQVGDGTTTTRLSPVNVTGMTSGILLLATGGKHACASTNATPPVLKCWGFNSSGQVGTGNLVNPQLAKVTVDLTTPVLSASNANSASWNLPAVVSATDAESGISQVRYNWDTNTMNTTCTANGITTATGATLPGPGNGTHTLYLCARDLLGNVITFSGTYQWDLVAPTIPGKVTTTWVGDHYVNTTFTAGSASVSTDIGGSGVASYSIFRSTDYTTTSPGCSISMASGLASPSFAVSGTNLPANGFRRDYCWTATDVTGNVTTYSTAEYVRMDSTAPTIPGKVTTTWVGDHYVNTTFTAGSASTSTDTGGSGVASYSIFRSTDYTTTSPGCSISMASGLASPSFAVSGTNLPANGFRRDYCWLAVDAAGNSSAASTPEYIRMDNDAPVASNITANVFEGSSHPANDVILTANATDAGGSTLTYRWYSGDTCSTIIPGATAITYTSLAPHSAGIELYSYIASDAFNNPSNCAKADAIWKNVVPTVTGITKPADNIWTSDREFCITVADAGGSVTGMFMINGMLRVGSTVSSGSDSCYTSATDLNGVTWYAYAYDSNTNSANTASRTAQIDSTAPSLPNIVAEPIYTAGTSNTVNSNIASDAGVGSVRYNFCYNTINSTTGCTQSGWAVSNSRTFTGLSSGQVYYYFVQVEDGLSNISIWNGVTSSTQDNIGPIISASNSNPGVWSNSALSAVVSVTDPLSGIAQVFYSWAGLTMDPACTTGGAITSNGATLNPPMGSTVLDLCAADNVGNVMFWSGNYNWDNLAPTVSATNSSLTWSSSLITAVVDVTSPGGSGIAEIRYNWGSNAMDVNCTTGGTVTVNAENLQAPRGGTTLYLCARTNANLVSTWNGPYNWDTINPNVFASNSGSNWFATQIVATVGADGASGGGIAEVRYNWGSNAMNINCSSGGIVTSSGSNLNAPSGGTTLYLCARDNAGNTGTWQGTYNWELAPPVISASNATTSWFVTQRTATVFASTTGNSPLVEVRYNWGSNTMDGLCTTGGIVTGNGANLDAPSGGITLYLCGRNSAGNVTTFSGQYNWSSVAPTISANNSSTSWFNSQRSATITATDFGGSGIVELRYSWGSNQMNLACTIGGTVTTNGATLNAPIGGSTLYLCVSNNAGLSATFNGQYDWENVTPTISASNSSATWVSTQITAVVSASDTGGSSLLEVRYNWASNAMDIGCTSGGTLTSSGANLDAPVGGTTLYLCTRDNAGNVAAWNGVYNWNADMPVVSASNASASWFNTLRTAIVSATATGGLTIAEVRYSWGSNAMNPACTTGGTVTTDGASLDAPQGGITLNLCARTNTGTTASWNGQYNWSNLVPSISANNNSTTWFNSLRSATVTATDASASGIAEIRYNWGSNPMNAGCTTGGVITTSGSVLDAPAEGTTLYLCVRDNIGNIATWNGVYNWEITAPVVPGIFSTTWTGDHFVKQSFTAAAASPSTDSGGSGFADYTFLMSANYTTTPTPCNIVIQSGLLDTTVVVTGNNLPTDGFRRDYCWTATDVAGNTSSASAGAYVWMDSSAPGQPAMIPAPAFTGGTSIIVSSTTVADASIGGVEYNFCINTINNPIGCDESGWSPDNSSTFSGLIDGQTYYYFVQARDALNHLTAWSSATFSTQDNAAPILSATNSSTSWFNSQRTAVVNVSDGTSGIAEVRYNWNVNDLTIGCAGGGTTTFNAVSLNAPVGGSILYLCSRNNSGQVSTWNGLYNWEVTPPIVLASNSGDNWQTSQIVAVVTLTDAGGSGLTSGRYSWGTDTLNAGCTTGGNTVSNGASLNAPVNGTILYLCGLDNAGNVTAWNGPYNWAGANLVLSATNNSSTWFNTQLSATITAQANVGFTLAEARYSWGSNAMNANCSTGGTLTSDTAVLNAPVGGTQLYLCARDNIGNTLTWNGTYNWDNIAPTAPGKMVTNWLNDHYINTSFTADMLSTAIEAGGSGLSSYSLWRGNDGETSCSVLVASGITIGTSLVSGNNLPTDGQTRYYCWTATDIAGNTSILSIAEYLRLDASAPQVPVLNTIPVTLGVNAISLTASTVTDSAVGGVQYNFCSNTIDSVAGCFANGWSNTNTADFTGLSTNSSYYFFVRSRDALGNISAWSGSVGTFVLPLSITITPTPTPILTNTPTITPTVSVTASPTATVQPTVVVTQAAPQTIVIMQPQPTTAVTTTTKPVVLPATGSVNQYKSDATTVVPLGKGSSGLIVLKTQATGQNHAVIFTEFEVKPLSKPFDGKTNITSSNKTTFVGEPVDTTASITDLQPGSYHWRYRAVDENSNVSAWVAFGNNAETDADFAILGATGINELPVTGDSALNPMSLKITSIKDSSPSAQDEIEFQFTTVDALTTTNDSIIIFFNGDFDLAAVKANDLEMIVNGKPLMIGLLPGDSFWGSSLDLKQNTITLLAPTSGEGYIPAATAVNVKVKNFTNPEKPNDYKLAVITNGISGRITSETLLKIISNSLFQRLAEAGAIPVVIITGVLSALTAGLVFSPVGSSYILPKFRKITSKLKPI